MRFMKKKPPAENLPPEVRKVKRKQIVPEKGRWRYRGWILYNQFRARKLKRIDPENRNYRYPGLIISRKVR